MTTTLQKYKKLNPLITQHLQPSELKAIELYAGEKQIKDFIDKDFANLDKLILTIAKLAGISPPPDKNTRLLIMGFIKERFGDFTQGDVKNAFMMAMAFELEIEDIKAYNSLSIQWVSSILFAYRTYRNKAVLKYQSEQQVIDRSEQDGNSTEKERDTIMKTACLDLFEQFKADPSMRIHDVGAAKYSYLYNKDLIKFSSEERDQYLSEAKETHIKRLKAEKLHSNSFHMKEIEKQLDSIVDGTENTRIMYIAKELALKGFFEKVIKAKIELSSIICQTIK